MPCTINNNTSNDLSQLEDLTQKLVPFAQKQIGFNRPPTINFNNDEKNAANPLGKTAQYDPSSMEIIVFVTGRHTKDILRSIAHELVHHGQNCRGDLDGNIQTELGYAQNNEHMRGMEREAYEVGNLCFRDWEDGIKQQLPLYETIYRESLIGGENMSTKDWRIHELNDLLMEKWGYKPPPKQKIEEGIPTTIVNDYETGEERLDEEEDDDGDGDDDDEDDESSSQLHLNPQSVEARQKKTVNNENKDNTLQEGDEERARRAGHGGRHRRIPQSSQRKSQRKASRARAEKAAKARAAAAAARDAKVLNKIKKMCLKGTLSKATCASIVLGAGTTVWKLIPPHEEDPLAPDSLGAGAFPGVGSVTGGEEAIPGLTAPALGSTEEERSPVFGGGGGGRAGGEAGGESERATGSEIHVDKGAGYINLFNKLTEKEKSAFDGKWREFRQYMRMAIGGKKSTRPMLHTNTDYSPMVATAIDMAQRNVSVPSKYKGAWKRRRKQHIVIKPSAALETLPAAIEEPQPEAEEISPCGTAGYPEKGCGHSKTGWAPGVSQHGKEPGTISWQQCVLGNCPEKKSAKTSKEECPHGEGYPCGVSRFGEVPNTIASGHAAHGRKPAASRE